MRQANLPLTTSKALSTVQLIQGDCLEVMPTLPANSVQMIFCDLPYQMTHHSYDVAICTATFGSMAKLVLAEKSILLATASMMFCIELIARLNLPFRHDLVWHKSRPSGFLTAKKMPMRSHEHILVFSQKNFVYNPQMVDAGKPCDFRPDSKIGEKVRIAPSAIVYKKNVTNLRYPTSVLAATSVSNNGRIHPAQKPVALLEWLIRTYTNEGDTVLDPTAGSMTTAIAALRTGRNAICIEKDAEYFRIGSERVRAEQERLNNL